MSPRCIYLLVALLIIPAFLTGCEERVVATHNAFVEPPTLPTAQPPQPDGPLEATGKAISSGFDSTFNFLFGWMSPKPQVTINNTYQQVNPQPQSQPQTPNPGTPTQPKQ